MANTRTIMKKYMAADDLEERMKVFVTGASGQLGYDVCLELKRRGIEFKGVSSADLDIREKAQVMCTLRDYAPDAVIHCAAYTKVDKAEEEPELCAAINTDGTKNISEACADIGAKLLYISTDYVFPGTGEHFYEPEDNTGPLSVYGKTKLQGELAVRTLLEKYFIVRVSWLFGQNGSNFVKTMLRLAETRNAIQVVDDQIGSPTYTADLAPLLCDMIKTDRYGIYHATNDGVCSWAEFAEEIFKLAKKNTRVERISSEQYPSKACRPKNSRMSKNILSSQGFKALPPWQDALKRYLISVDDLY